MTKTINGIGTMFYGQRDFNPDGSYITTQWFVFFFWPIFPIKSMRVKYVGEGTRDLITFYSAQYLILEKVPLCGKQIIFTWTFIIGLIGVPIYSTSVLFDLFDPTFAAVLSPVIIIIIASLPYLLHRRAKKQASLS